MDWLTETPGNRRPTSRIDALTKKQVAIIELIARGQTDKEIAREVGVSYRTVRTHLERLYDLNGVHCRASLVAVVADRRRLPGPLGNPNDRERDTRESRPGRSC